MTTSALLAFATPAAAQSCTISPVASPTGTVTCAAGATTNTTNAGTSPAADRAYLLDTTTTDADVAIDGAITGYGLAFGTNVGAADTMLTVVNNGGVTVDAGNSPTAGGTAALELTAQGGTSIDYSGAGDIINMGTAGNGLTLSSSGAGDLTAVVDGNVMSAAAGTGVYGESTGTGSIDLTTNGAMIEAGYAGLFGRINNAASTGDVTLTNNSAISSVTAPGTLIYGVYGDTNGLGSVTVTNSGAIGSDTDVVQALGVSGSIANTASDADVTVTNSGDVYSVDASIYTYNDGTGGITVDNSGNLTSTSTGPGIYVQQAGVGTTGMVDVTNSGTINAAVNGIQTSNAGTGGITITNDGDITAGEMGIRARGLSATQTGDITVQGSGNINAGTLGIWAPTAGTGNVTVNYTGAITAGDTGVLAEATTGMADITVGDVTGANNGVQVVSTGDQAITANGVVTGTAVAGIHSDTTGNRMITIGADGDVTGGAEAILLTNTGTATIDNAGIIGDDSAMVALNATAAGATTLTNASTGTINGTVMFGGGDDTFANAGTFNTSGTSDFGAGDDTFTNTGTINLDGDTTFANLETLNLGGTTNTNGYTLTGTGALNNTGTLNSDGGMFAGFTSFSNSGDLYLADTTTVPAAAFDNTGTVYSVDGDATLTGQTVFNNMGTISMVDDAADDTLTIDSDYVGGTGARLAVDADYDVADMLIVNGDISGSTAVDANVLGTGALVSGGVQVVDGMGASTANAFTLGNITGGSALVNYAVEQDGSDYYLTGALNQAGFTPLRLASMVNDFWYPSADEIIANLAVPYKGGDGIGFWADGYLSREKFGDNNVGYSFGGVNYTVDQRVKLGHMGLQAGVDYGMGGTGRIGLTAGYSRHKGRDGNDIEAKGWNLGIYGAFGGVTGFHGEALAKYDRYKVDFKDGFFDPFNPKVKSFGFDGSLGYRIPMGGENSSFDLAAGLSHVSSKIDDTVAYGLTYDYDRVKSTRGRASARYNFGGDLQPYVQATAYHEFANAGRVGLFDGVNTYDLENAKRGTWGRIEGGISGSPNRFPTLAAWADFGDVKGIGARLGMRFGAEAEAAPPPPPPPPPPAEPAPPPATQTCYDGSVILATDTCPVPPPPPPPPPAPERG